jgi:hypothetical protein
MKDGPYPSGHSAVGGAWLPPEYGCAGADRSSLARRLLRVGGTSRVLTAHDSRINRAAPLCIGAATLALAASAAVAAALHKSSFDGLDLVEETRTEERIAAVYVRPNATLAAYRRVMLDPVEVAFDKAWMPRPAVSAKDRERIRRELSEEFRIIFADELEKKGGYALVQTTGLDVLRVTAAIIDLYIEPPGVGTSDQSRSHVVAASHMTLIAELRDAESGAILARVAERRTAKAPGRIPGVLQWTTKESNRAEARRILRTWAERLRTSLDAAREAAP